MTPKNVCGECRLGNYDDELKEYSCDKRTFGIDRFQDTSDCKDFENKQQTTEEV
jgi:hypothetical protein